MRTVAAMISTICWALWFGGLVALFIFVQMLFREDRSVAVEAAPRMFALFEKYQLILAAAALVSTILWRIVARQTIVSWVFFLLALATLGAVAEPIFISGEMQKLRLEGQSSGARFKKLHGQSMLIYVGETLVLLVAGVSLPFAITHSRDARLRTVEGTA
jgi:hypothetical protein